MARSWWFLGVVASAAFLMAPSAAAADKPNVLLICIDDLKPVLGCYGDSVAQTPHIDALAASAVLFQSAYCNQAVCSPSRNALMTGLRPQTLGIYDLPTHFRHGAPEAMTVAQHFRQHGYRTEAMGKILHTGHGNHEDPASWSVPHWRPKASQYALAESTSQLRRRNDRARGAATESADVADDAYADGLIASEAVRRLEAAAAHPDQPFFIAVGFLKPHLPFVAPKRYWDLYDPAKLPMPQVHTAPAGAPSYAPTSGGELRGYGGVPEKGEIDETLTRHLIHGYYAATSYADAQIGRVLDALADNALADNTIVVLWGDHGWHLGDHGMWCKHTNYEQAARIPVIVRAPGAAAGAKTEALIETVDIYPTLCELAGLPQREGLDGVSFAAVLSDPSAGVHDSVIHVYPRSNKLGRAIRTARYRLVEWKKPGDPADTAEWELYDYQSDPLETKNLAAEQPQVVAELKAILAKHPEARPQIKAADTAAVAEPIRVSDVALRLHQGALVVDGHNDLPWAVREAGGFSDQLDIVRGAPQLHTDIPRLRRGGVGAQFWSVYVPVSTHDDGVALRTTLEQIALVKQMVQRYPESFEIALGTEDIQRIRRSGKIASLIGVEGGHSIENSLSVLRQLYAEGARYMTLTHSATLDWADSCTDQPRHGGLSPFGEAVVLEMNRLGMLVDISHVSADCMRHTLRVTQAPVIFSHSSAAAIAPHPRNVPDDVLRLTAQNGGIVMINFFSAFIDPQDAARSVQRTAYQQQLKQTYPGDTPRQEGELAKWDVAHPAAGSCTVHDVLDHIEHVIKVAGIDHVGLGSDFDGVPALPEQLDDVSTYPVITQGLLDRGYSQADIRKVLGENLMRVFRQAEQVAQRTGSRS